MSVIVLIGITILLATLLYLADKYSGNDGWNRWWTSLWWVFSFYLDISDSLTVSIPETFLGRAVVSIAGIVRLLLFAVVTGYFLTLIREWLRSMHLKECEKKIVNFFRRKKCRNFPHLVVRPYESLASVEAQLKLKEGDIIDAVMASSVLRLRNLADGELRKDHPHDRLVIERFPVMNTDYGCRVNRKSMVTIVCPTALSEPGIGNFSWYVAQFGRFNYVSREVRLPGEEDMSYYRIKCDDAKNTPIREKYLEDINSMAYCENSWIIILIAGSDIHCSYYYVHSSNHEQNKETLTMLKAEMRKELASHGVIYNPAANNSSKASNLENRVRRTSNALTIRLSYHTMLWKDDRISVAEGLAKAIRSVLVGETTSMKGWLQEEGIQGYQYKDETIK